MGFGLTLGNALRRVLLSSLPGASIYAVEVEGARHEFTALEGIEEDVTNIILNLKDLVLKIDETDDSNKRLEINVEEGKVVTGADIPNRMRVGCVGVCFRVGEKCQEQNCTN